MRILVVRHGQCNWPSLKEIRKAGHLGNPGLNSKGIAEVAKLAKTLRDSSITAIYSSFAQRAQDSAKILSKELGIEVAYLPLLRGAELPKGKDLTKLVAKISKGEVNWQEEWLRGWPNTDESPEEYQARIGKVIDKILRKYSKKDTILVVGHEETVWAFLNYLKGIDFSKAAKTKVEYASVTEFSN